jgi:flavin-dependent dehydrogenase
MTPPLYDVAVVGGGPAGCSAAITLAKQGARVILFEAKTYPHHKVCGEFLSPECTQLLDTLDLSRSLHALNPVKIETACITAPDGTAWETRFPGPAWGITRSALDHMLANQASALGVEICEGTTVSNIGGDLDQGFTIDTRTPSAQEHLQARTVIAAHGKRSGLDRALNRRFLTQPQPFIGLKAHFQGPALPGRIELHGFTGGYCGMSEIEGGAMNVCLLVHQAIFQQVANGDIQPFIAWMQTQNPRLGDWLSQAKQISERWLSIGQVPFVRKRAIVNDVLMAGDSAGLIVPLAGDGIAMAMQSGQIAAATLINFLGHHASADHVRGEYPANWRREFGSRMRLGRVLQILMLRPRLLGLGLRLLISLPPLGKYLVSNTRDSRFIASQRRAV